MRPGIEIDQLRTFCEVADTLSFTKAASRINRVQSAVSSKIRRLEATVGAQLFERNRRQVELTAEGEKLLQYARRVLRLTAEVRAEFDLLALEGTVRVGMTATTSHFLPEILTRFAQAHPRVELEVLCDLSWELLDAYDEGRLDLALVTQNCGRSGGEVVRKEPLVWVTANGHHPEHEDPLPLAVFAKGCIFRDAVLRAVDSIDRPWRIAFSSPNFNGVSAAITSGFAIGALAKSTVPRNFRILGAKDGMPKLPSFSVLMFSDREFAAEPVKRLADEITGCLAH